MSDTIHRERTQPPERPMPERPRLPLVTGCCGNRPHRAVYTYALRDTHLAQTCPHVPGQEG
jgi:hypothetical protein